tara:strand:- start:233 stop:2821 length:2589 start_codon:yes stop_codon:yes gene_type:complete
MSLGANKQALMGAAGAGGAADDFYTHQIAKSARFTGSGKLSRTAGTPTNIDKFTISFWVKRSDVTAHNNLVFGDTDNSNYQMLRFSSTELLELHEQRGAGDSNGLRTIRQVFRDPETWYHIVWVYDSGNSTETNREIFYLNGERLTNVEGWDGGYPAQNRDSVFNQSGATQVIGGASAYYGNYLSGYMAEVVFNDGQVYAASDYGETKNEVWIPKDPSGLTFGNNGFYLDFANSSAMGNDVSGNNNDFTASNVDTHDQMLDSPTFGSSNGGNFATWNILSRTNPALSYGASTFSEGNLAFAGDTGGTASTGSTFSMQSGKWYAEIMQSGSPAGGWPAVGVIYTDKMGTAQGTSNIQPQNGFTAFIAMTNGNLYKFDASSGASYGSAFGNGDICNIAVDIDAGKIWWGKNGTYFASGNPATGANAGDTFTAGTTLSLWVAGYNGSGAVILNAGQDGTFAGAKTAQGNTDNTGYGNFYYAPKTIAANFLALCSGNLPVADSIDPAQTDDNYPQKQFNMLQYTGNGSERTLTTQFQIDMGWNRSTIQGQNWYTLDTSRGWFGASSNNYYLKMDTSDSEATLPQYNFKAQSGNNITLTGGTWFNSGSHTQQMWYWKANGGTTTTPSGGTLATTVQANTDAGFSIVQYVGDGGTSAFTLAHGLGKKPSVVLMKDRDSNGNNNLWHCFPINTSLPANSYFYTSDPASGSTSTNGTISNTTTTDAVIGVNRTSSSGGGQTISENGDKFLMYAWAEIEGFSKISVYVGNGNADGTFVYCGFKPAFIALKDYDSGADWRTYDVLNDPFNLSFHYLALNTNSAINGSANTTDIDILSNGFKIRGDASTINTSGNRYFFMAWASNPFKYATAR